jgi:hypothetical protein
MFCVSQPQEEEKSKPSRLLLEEEKSKPSRLLLEEEKSKPSRLLLVSGWLTRQASISKALHYVFPRAAVYVVARQASTSRALHCASAHAAVYIVAPLIRHLT